MYKILKNSDGYTVVADEIEVIKVKRLKTAERLVARARRASGNSEPATNEDVSTSLDA